MAPQAKLLERGLQHGFFACDRNHTRGDACYDPTRSYRTRHDSACAYNATVAELYILQNHRLRPDPAPIANPNATSIHRRSTRRDTRPVAMVAVGNIDVGSEHIEIANFDETACVNHHMAIEIVAVADLDPNVGVIDVFRPQPATLREGVIASDRDLIAASNPAASLHAIFCPLPHSEHPVRPQAHAADRAAWHAKQQRFKNWRNRQIPEYEMISARAYAQPARTRDSARDRTILVNRTTSRPRHSAGAAHTKSAMPCKQAAKRSTLNANAR